MRYIDGFCIAGSKKNLSAYRKIAQKIRRNLEATLCARIPECAGDDLDNRSRLLRLKHGETAIFAWIV